MTIGYSVLFIVLAIVLFLCAVALWANRWNFIAVICLILSIVSFVMAWYSETHNWTFVLWGWVLP